MAKTNFLNNIIESNTTFQEWINYTNQLSTEMAYSVVTTSNTANGSTTSGNSVIEGVFGANTIFVNDSIRGGSITTPANLEFSSNVVISNNNLITEADANVIFSSDVSFDGAAKTFTVSTLTFNITTNDVNFTGDSLDISGVNANVSSNVYFSGSIFDVETDITVNGDITSTGSVSVGGDLSVTGNVTSSMIFSSNVNINGDYFVIPTGNTSQRTSDTGSIRFNSETEEFEGRNSSEWKHLDAPGLYANVSTKGSDYTITEDDRTNLIRANTSITLTLPSAATVGNGFIFTAKADGGTITVEPDGAETIDGDTDLTLADGGSTVIYSDGTNWFAATAGGNSALVDFQFTANTGQAVFSGNDDNSNPLSYTQGNIIVSLNGVILDSGQDYTANNGTSIVLSSNTAQDDVLGVVAFKSFTVADALAKTQNLADIDDASAGRNNLGLGSISTEDIGSISANIVPDTDGTRSVGSAEKNLAGVHSDLFNGGALSGFRNRLINPDFAVDIEGNAAGVTANGDHVVEGWALSINNDVTTQTLSRTTGRVTGNYALRYTVTTGSDASLAATQYGQFRAAIEGYDVADFAWGTADAEDAHLSFWVRSNTTGTFAATVRNESGSRTYPVDVTINAANTWERKEITIPGETSGNWNKTNGAGMEIVFCLGTGSTYQATSDAWAAAATYFGTPTQDNFLDTNGNWLEITEPQIEKGGFSPFEWRPYSMNLEHCERYYEYIYEVYMTAYSADSLGNIFYKPKRVVPTISAGTTNGSSLTVRSVEMAYAYRTGLTSNWIRDVIIDARMI